jgi:hypothetical protein
VDIQMPKGRTAWRRSGMEILPDCHILVSDPGDEDLTIKSSQGCC